MAYRIGRRTLLLTLWSMKGGSGTSTAAAGLASTMVASGSGRARSDVLLVDLDGDLPALMGLASSDGPGVADWLATPRSDAAALGRLEVEVGSGLSLVPRGAASTWPADRAEDLVDALAADSRSVVVDAGTVGVEDDGGCAALRRELIGGLGSEGSTFLVIRPCYLALRRVLIAMGDAAVIRPDGVVLVSEHGRALDDTDVARALAVPVCATVPVDPAVARAVDAGLITSRPPRSLRRALDGLADRELR